MMDMRIQFLALVCLGLVNTVSGCCWACLWCSKSVVQLKPLQLLTGDIRDSGIIHHGLRPGSNLPGKPHKEVLSAGSYMQICDGNDDLVLSLEEFDNCLSVKGAIRNLQKMFVTLDKNGNDQLSLIELDDFEVVLTGSGDCYEDLTTHCAAKFVMYQRTRGVQKEALCGGLELYQKCIGKSAAECDDPRTDKLETIFSWTEKQLQTVCAPDDDDDDDDGIIIDPKERATLHCMVSLIRSLHGSQPPCVAMATFTECLQTKAGAQKGEELFDDIIQLPGCTKK